MSRRNLVTVSGLQPTPGAGRSGEVASFGRSASYTSGFEDDDSSTAFGERILTAKTQKELAEENAMLRRLLDRERKKNSLENDAATNEDLNCSKPFSISFQMDTGSGEGNEPVEKFPEAKDGAEEANLLEAEEELRVEDNPSGNDCDSGTSAPEIHQ